MAMNISLLIDNRVNNTRLESLVKIFFCFSFLFCFSNLNSQDSMSLMEAVEEGLKNNRNMLNANRDIDIAKKRRWETISTGLPQISAIAGYNKDLKQPVSIAKGEYFGGPPNEYIPLTFGTQQSISALTRIDQLIFDGSYLVGLQASKTFLTISRQNKTKTELEVKTLIVEAYLNVLEALEREKIVRKNLNNINITLNQFKKIFEQGLIEEEILQQLQITKQSLNSSLEYTKKIIPITKQIFNISIGADLDSQINLSDTLLGLCIISNSPPNFEDWTIEKNIDYQIAQNNLKSSKLLLKLERFRAMPTISGYLTGGYDGFNDEFKFFKQKQKWYSQSSIGLTVRLPIFSSLGGQARTEQAKINVEKAKSLISQTYEQVLLDQAKALNEYDVALQNFKTSQQTLKLAESIEKKNQIKFNEGVVGSFDLRQAQLQLYDAQNQNLTSMKRVVKARSALSLLFYSSEILKQ
tara:strand:+ start:7411 stop:8811 length:1401 start_codon:yes stop_codon:yes gene_type:complete